MVRSSGHHRKRSLSRSLSPSDHKRTKSSYRDRDKERSKRRSRSRDRQRRSRSRDRKSKDKRSSESRVRSKPLKLKRRSRSRSRSKSREREHVVKKEEKKDVKADDEPFDPTNLDKQKSVDDFGTDEDWIVTDTLQEEHCDESVEPSKNDENSFNNSELHEDNNVSNNTNSEPVKPRSKSRSRSKSSYSRRTNHYRSYDKYRSTRRSTNGITRSLCNQCSTKVMDIKLDQDSEFHKLRMKNEKEKHNAQMELIQLQREYWQSALRSDLKKDIQTVDRSNTEIIDKSIITDTINVSCTTTQTNDKSFIVAGDSPCTTDDENKSLPNSPHSTMDDSVSPRTKHVDHNDETSGDGSAYDYNC